MRKLLLAALLFASGPACLAQFHQFSLRTGVTLTPGSAPTDESYILQKPKLAHWNQELSYGLQKRSGLRYETALQHFADERYAVSVPGSIDYSGSLHIRTAAFGMRFSAGYDLMRLFGKERRLRLNAGLALRPALFSERVEHNYSDFAGRFNEDRYTNHRLTCFGGLVLNPEYRLDGDWWLSAHLGLERRLVEPASFEGGYDSNLSSGTGIRNLLGFSVGIARQF